MNQNQIPLPLKVPDEQIYREVMRKQSLGAAIELCADIAGFGLEKTARDEFEKRGFNVDKGQFSRWKDNSEGILWPKLAKVMDICDNDAPLFWMNHQRNIDLYSLRRQESDLERENRILREENEQLKRDRAIEMRALKELRSF